MSELLFRYVPDPDDEVGQLWFEVRTKNFSGSGFYWSTLFELPKLIGRLRAYPLTEEVSSSWGCDAANGNDAVLLLRLSPSHPLGGLEAIVEVADLDDPHQRVKTKLQTDYACLDRMLTELGVLIQRREGEALLQGF